MNDNTNLAIDSILHFHRQRVKELFVLKAMRRGKAPLEMITIQKKRLKVIQNKIMWEVSHNEELFRKNGLL